jgi:ribosomal protein L24
VTSPESPTPARFKLRSSEVFPGLEEATGHAQINIHTCAGVSLLFHLRRSKRQNRHGARKFRGKSLQHLKNLLKAILQMGRKHKKLKKQVGANPQLKLVGKIVQNTNLNGHESPLWKTVEIFSAIIFAALAALLWNWGHPILSLFSTFSSVALGLALVANNATAVIQSKLIVWGMYFAVCFALFTGTFLWAYKLWNSEDRFFGPLTPANDPFPALSEKPSSLTNFPSDCIFIFAGGGMFVTVTNRPFTLICAGGKDLLTLEWTKSGAAISGEFFGKNGNVVAVIKTNNFVVNKLNYLTKETPDRHTLIVRDQQDVEVVNLRFLNPRAFLLTGTIRLPNSEDVTITKTSVQYGRTVWTAPIGGSAELVFYFISTYLSLSTF